MNNPQVGQLVTSPQHRDAIHVAILPIEAGEFLRPGERVQIDEDGKAILPLRKEKIAGIVDPFLVDIISPGQTFWLFMLPNTITSIRHDWTHPAIKEVVKKDEAAIGWLTHFGSKVGMNYHELIEAAKKYISEGKSYSLGFETPVFVYDQNTIDEFWKNFEIVTKINPYPED